MTQAVATPDAVVEAIDRLTREQGYPPNYREIGSAVGGIAVSAVRYWLDRLEQQGRVARTPGLARSVRVTATQPAHYGRHCWHWARPRSSQPARTCCICGCPHVSGGAYATTHGPYAPEENQ